MIEFLLCAAYVPCARDVVVRSIRCLDRVVVCDDGSTDLTGEVAEALGASLG